MNAKQASRRYLVRLAAAGWECWSFDPPELLSDAVSLADFEVPPEATVLIPTSGIVAIPLWLSTTKESELRDMILLQLESRGFSAIESMEYSIVEAASQQTLVTAWVLPALPVEIEQLPMIASCAPSPFAEALAEDACTLWREGERWVCAITRSGKMVASQALGASRADGDLRAEVVSLIIQLVREKILPKPPDAIVIRDQSASMELNGWPVAPVVEPRPAPIWPTGPSFLPRIFAEKKADLRRRGVFRKVAAAVSLVAAIVLAGFAVHTAWLWVNVNRISSRLAAIEPKVSEIRRMADSWNALAPAIEPDQTAVEILFRCSRHLPSAGVRFTLFQIKDGSVLLLGEGDNVSGVVELQNKLSNDKELADFRWKMPPPRLLPNGVARFEISGDRLSYASVSK